jgi:lysophospholipase L1-like esterase
VSSVVLSSSPAAVVSTASDGLDLNSLLLGDPSAQEWLTDPNCPAVVGSGGPTASIDGFLDAAFCNVDAAAPGTGNIWAYFSPPLGCTTASLDVEAWLPSGVGAASIRIQLRDSTGVTVLFSINNQALSASPTVYSLALTGLGSATLYRAWISFTGVGTSGQAQAMIRSIRVRPTNSTDAFFTSGFYRYNVSPRMLWDNCRSGLLNSIYQSQSPAARFVFDTDATSFFIEYYSTFGGNIFVFVDGRYFTNVSSGTGGIQFVKVTGLPTGRKRVEISSPIQVIGSTNDFSTVTGTYLRAVDVASGTYFLPVPPPYHPERVVLLGDSILLNNGYGTPFVPLIYFIRRLVAGSVAMEAFSGRQLCGLCGINGGNPSNVGLLVDQLVRHDPTQIVCSLGTNDFGNTPPIAAATYATAYATFLDALHTALPRARIIVQTPTPRTAESTPNSAGAVLDDMRNGGRLAAATRPYASVLEGMGIVTTGDLYDGLHPSFTGNTKMASAVASSLWPSPQAGLALPVRLRPAPSSDPVTPSKLTSATLKAWWRADNVATGTSGANATILYDKSGLGNNGNVTGTAVFVPNIGTVFGATGNNRPAVHFSGGSRAVATFACALPFTWVCVFAMNSIGVFGTNDLLISGQGGSGSGVTVFMSDSPTHQFMYNGSFGFSGNSPAVVGTLAVVVGIFAFSGGTSSVMSINGAEITANAGVTQTDSAFISLGAYSDGTRSVDVFSLETQIYQGLMSATDRATLSAGLQKYHRLVL